MSNILSTHISGGDIEMMFDQQQPLGEENELNTSSSAVHDGQTNNNNHDCDSGETKVDEPVNAVVLHESGYF